MDWRALELEGDIVFVEVCVCSEVYVLVIVFLSDGSLCIFVLFWISFS